MLRRQIMSGLGVLLILVTAKGQVQQSIKGYELYSWKVKGNWHYSLLAGTNRAKTYDEIISKTAERIGSEALEAELKKIPKGEEVFWMSDAPAGASKSTAGRSLNVKHPSRQRIKGIKAMCDKLGIKLRLT